MSEKVSAKNETVRRCVDGVDPTGGQENRVTGFEVDPSHGDTVVCLNKR